MQIETWKPIKDYEGWYEVSDLGNVRRLQKARGAEGGKILKPLATGNGYYSVALSKQCKVKMFQIHRLVAETFLPPDPSRPFVNHKDGVRTNAALSNLEWCTAKENSKHSKDVLHNHRKLLPEDVVEIRRAYYEDHVRLVDLAEKYNVGKTLISKVCTNTLWSDIPGRSQPAPIQVSQDCPEKWKPVPNFPAYEVSNYGKVRVAKSQYEMSIQYDPRTKSEQLRLCKDGVYKTFTLPMLVSDVFIGPANGRPVAHKNGNNRDNRVNNLEYVAHQGCLRRAIRNSGGQYRT